MTEGLTPADKDRLKQLELQLGKLEDMKKVLVDIGNLPPTPAPPVVATAKLAESFISEWENFTVGFSQTGNVNNLSDADLLKLIGKLTSDIQDRVSAQRSTISPYNIQDPSNPTGSASLTDPFIGVEQQNLNNAIAALNARNQSLTGGGVGIGIDLGSSATQKSLTQISSTLGNINSNITTAFFGRG